MKMEDLTQMTSVVPNLAQEIRDGTLMLRGDDRARFAFSFNVGDYAIGVYAIRSIGPHALAFLRAWNKESEVRDPVSGLVFVNKGREFSRVCATSPLFIFEFTSDRKALVSKVAFQAGRVRVLEADAPGMPAELRFEALELRDIRILS